MPMERFDSSRLWPTRGRLSSGLRYINEQSSGLSNQICFKGKSPSYAVTCIKLCGPSHFRLLSIVSGVCVCVCVSCNIKRRLPSIDLMSTDVTTLSPSPPPFITHILLRYQKFQDARLDKDAARHLVQAL